MNTSFKNPLEGALYCLERGFKVFPVNKNSKTPAVKDWQYWAKTTTAKTVKKLGTQYNWGVCCSLSNLLILDIDPKNNGHKTFEALSLALPPTLKIKTPSGGHHLYFKGQGKTGVNVLGRGVDVRSKGGYVVAPGSSINGARYEIESHIDTIPAIPEVIVPLLKKREKILAKSDNELLIEEGERNHKLTALAGMLRSYGLGQESILASLVSINENHLDSPVDISELELISQSISRYKPSISKAASEFLEVLTPRKQIPNLAQILARKLFPREWVINEWLPKGEVTSLYGSGGMGKSLLSLQLAISVTQGAKFLGIECQKTSVLCVFCEDNEAEIHRRAEGIMNKPEYAFNDVKTLDNLYICSRVGLPNDLARVNDKGNDLEKGSFNHELEVMINEMPSGHKLLILDNLADIYLADENVRERVNKFIKTILGGLIKKHNLTILILGHPSRTGQKGDLLSGSTAWENSVRNRLTLSLHAKLKDTTVFRRSKSNYAKSGEEIFLTYQQGYFRPVTTEQEEIGQLPTGYQDIIHNLDECTRDGLNSVRNMALELLEKKETLFSCSTTTLERTIEKALETKVTYEGYDYVFSKENVKNMQCTKWIVRTQCDSSLDK